MDKRKARGKRYALATILPRIAGISSFGAGGANAHVLIEEYIEQEPALRVTVTPRNPALVVLSAKNEERLQAQVEQLLAWMGSQALTAEDLANLAYTLQVGREEMDERLAMIVGSAEELNTKLTAYLAGEEDIEDLYCGQVKRNKEALGMFADEDMAKALDAWIAKGKHGKLLELWVNGLVFDWTRLYGEAMPRRMSLPTYPFAKERYWVPESGAKARVLGAAAALHPLVHRNTSDFSEQRFSATFSGEEFFLSDHVISCPVRP